MVINRKQLAEMQLYKHITRLSSILQKSQCIQSQCNLNISIENQSTVTLPTVMGTIDTKSLPNTLINSRQLLRMSIMLI